MSTASVTIHSIGRYADIVLVAKSYASIVMSLLDCGTDQLIAMKDCIRNCIVVPRQPTTGNNHIGSVGRDVEIDVVNLHLGI